MELHAPLVAPTVKLAEQIVRELPVQFDVDALTSHHFSPGQYMRELRLPAGAFIVGKQHATDNVFYLAKGTLSIWDGRDVVTVTAPFASPVKPGDKRVGYAHDDVVCFNIHANPDNERDLAVLESRYIAKETTT